MSTMNLAPPTGALVRTKIQVYNTTFSQEEMIADGADVDIDYDQSALGWVTINDLDIWMFSFAYEEGISRCPCGEIVVDYDDLWIFGVEPLYKARAAFYFDGDQGNPENFLRSPSRVVINVDNTGMTEDDLPVGKISISGFRDELRGDQTYSIPVTEFIDITGPGSYVSDTVFVQVDTMVCDFPDGTGMHSTVSLWGNTGATAGRREARVWMDANGDGVYGLVFAGYLYVSDIRPVFGGRRQVALKLEGYQAFLQCNDYVCGYRCGHRCLSYSKTGESGECLVNSENFRKSATACWVGDYGTRHPDGTLCSRHCSDYNAGDEVLPFDGWTYYKDYAPTTETGYEYCPPSYFRALQAACNMANSYETNSVVSRPWALKAAYTATLSEDVDESTETFPVKWSADGWWVETGSYITIGSEIMVVNGHGPDSISVKRGIEGCTYPRPHNAGDLVIAPSVARAEGGGISPLAATNRLTAPNLKQSIANTLGAMSDTATIEITNAEYCAWADKFKQINFEEFYLPSAASDGAGDDAILTLREIDFIDEPRVSYGNVVNMVTSQITLADNNTVTVKLAAEDMGVDGYDQSVKIFGRVAMEVTNEQLNCYSPMVGKIDFMTWATKYLTIRAFPMLTQEVCVFGFVPDEHYWKDMANVRASEEDEYVLPYLMYTDPENKSIDLRGTIVHCPDYSLPVDENGQYRVSEFVVESVRTVFTPPGNLETYLCLCRYTTPADFGVQS